MRIERLHAENFRLLQDVTIDLANGVNLFTGENAQGKTTILEAVSYLSSGRSFRTARDRECIRFQEGKKEPGAVQFAGSDCRFISHDVPRRIRCAITATEKSCWVDDNKLQKLGDLWGQLNVVIFVPSDIELVRGGPDLRRAFIGELLARTSRYDLQVMQRYAVALRERNALLRDMHSKNSEQFDVFENQMGEYGAKLLLARDRTIRQLGALTEEHLNHLTGGKDQFRMVHEPGWPKSAGLPADAITEDNTASSDLKWRLMNLWEHDREADAERGFTQNGPHRGDVGFSLNEHDARTFSSQGQARSIALALRLAEIEMLTLISGEAPVLLLDDILGDLDKNRTHQFAELLSKRGIQSLITATDSQDIESRFRVTGRFRVAHGKVERINPF